MSDVVKGAIILAVAAMICTGAVIYFGPFQSCVRATNGSDLALRICAMKQN